MPQFQRDPNLSVHFGVNLTPQPTNRLVQVNLNVERYAYLVNIVYRHLASTFPNVRKICSQEQFLKVNMSILAKRVSWVREKTIGMRDTARVNLNTNVPMSLSLFHSLACIGVVEVRSKGLRYLPTFEGLAGFAQVNIDDYMAYNQLVTTIGPRHLWHDTMPSQPEGNQAFFLAVEVATDRSSVQVWGDNSEVTSDQAMLAAIVWQTSLSAGQVYGFSYGIIAEPDQQLLRMVMSFTKNGYVGELQDDVDQPVADGGVSNGSSDASL